ncbi:lon protease homolog 2, peroxisomal-like isoform X1 [Olea europaea subsp. europaea]|uniref:Lon protease homolog 2, peroxisomal-like isoform X1 n=1 Tax=Olea europaea subsp. europaea TaxID=158383 RepID=A0A8S0UDB6_OLEEU|nr:lon protease homolog 2, peroxisomal-like isoform X1 [Olea europaea subsp. europaea]
MDGAIEVTPSEHPVSDGDGETVSSPRILSSLALLQFFWFLLLLLTVESPSSLFAACLRRTTGCRSTIRRPSPQKSPSLWLCTPQLRYGATLARGLWLAPGIVTCNDLGAYNSSRVYLDLLADLPWQKASEKHELDLKAAKDHLDSDHYGLVKIKHRIIEYLAVRKGHMAMFSPRVHIDKLTKNSAYVALFEKNYSIIAVASWSIDVKP